MLKLIYNKNLYLYFSEIILIEVSPLVIFNIYLLILKLWIYDVKHNFKIYFTNKNIKKLLNYK